MMYMCTSAAGTLHGGQNIILYSLLTSSTVTKIIASLLFLSHMYTQHLWVSPLLLSALNLSMDHSHTFLTAFSNSGETDL